MARFTGVSVHSVDHRIELTLLQVLIRTHKYRLSSGEFDYMYEIFVGGLRVFSWKVEDKGTPEYPSEQACAAAAALKAGNILYDTLAAVQGRLCGCGHADTAHYGADQPCKECVCSNYHPA